MTAAHPVQPPDGAGDGADLIDALASYASSVAAVDAPEEACRQAKLCILDMTKGMRPPNLAEPQ